MVFDSILKDKEVHMIEMLDEEGELEGWMARKSAIAIGVKMKEIKTNLNLPNLSAAKPNMIENTITMRS